MKIEKMTEGMRLHQHGRDGSILRRAASWPVVVLKIDLSKRQVFASWNGNPPRWVDERHAQKWRLKSRHELEQAKAAKLTAP